MRSHQRFGVRTRDWARNAHPFLEDCKRRRREAEETRRRSHDQDTNLGFGPILDGVKGIVRWFSEYGAKLNLEKRSASSQRMAFLPSRPRGVSQSRDG